jgi:hypothetical protein
MNRSESLRSIVAQGWTLMFVVFVANLVIDLVKNTVGGAVVQTRWAGHLNMGGVQFILVIMALYALMPMLVRAVSAPWFRWAVVGLTVFMALFVAAHEVSHLSPVDKPFGLFHALDITHHLLAIGVTVAAIGWARQTDHQASPLPDAVPAAARS